MSFLPYRQARLADHDRGAQRHYAALPTLGERLKLPSGWRYTTMMPETDLVLGAKGAATVVQDELENTYQKRD